MSRLAVVASKPQGHSENDFLKIKLMSWQTFRAALVFYTCLPLSPRDNQGNGKALDFRGIAVYAPLVGVVIGVILGVCDWGLAWLWRDRSSLTSPLMPLLQAGLVILLGLLLTGGLHLDGAMDTADGLAVTDPARRLEVMTDSTTGAYGVMAAIAILFLKIAALATISDHRFWILMAASAWSRWGQLRAIAAYPYLKLAGKGKFHRDHVKSWQVWLVFFLMLTVSCAMGIAGGQFTLVAKVSGIGIITSWSVGAWLHHKLGGHTGDTYGAIVEWSEALFFLIFAAIGVST
jgi:adenosylcobinamide-GDP ribazoletransferase